MQVKEIMTRDVVVASADAAIGDVAELLARHRISAVPITDEDGAVIGLVSEFDLLAKRGHTARDVMSRGVISVDEETDVEDVRFLLIDRQIKRVPVFSGQKLVGIVSRADIIRQMAMEWVCEVCGEPIRAERAPERCPKCGAPGERFRHEPQPPGQ